jgi:hypothetical protein
VLKEAANRALTQSGKNNEAPTAESSAEGGAAPAEQNLQPKPSKEERILRDVETGLNLLFGK